MSEIINLRTVRKRLTRQKAAQRAAENRIAYGRPKNVRAREEGEADKAERLLDAHRLTRGDDP